MAFRKLAYAQVIKPHVQIDRWASSFQGSSRVASTQNLIVSASDIFQREFNPNDYLLTHATIVCSVDTYDVPNSKLGSVFEGNFAVNRKFSNYRIDPKCDEFINGNNDAWSRGVLLKSYGTFKGAHNFVEHVQIEDLSKGRILDAVARDIGSSVYVDILIATDKKHAQLIQDIKSGKMSTLSMGCTTQHTTCTKCGHVAADDTELCDHVRYQKGNYFYDDQGRKHRIAELCGHESLEPHGGVQFIEASWVATPAFQGAVLRNVVPLNGNAQFEKRIAEVLKSDAQLELSDDMRLKVASMLVTSGILDELDDVPDDSSEEKEEPKDKIKEVEDRVYDEVTNRVEQRIRQDLAKDKTPPKTGPADSNDNLQKTSSYVLDLSDAFVNAQSGVDLMNRIARIDQSQGNLYPVDVYRVALRVGGVDPSNLKRLVKWKNRIRRLAGDDFFQTHEHTLLGLGRILDGWSRQ